VVHRTALDAVAVQRVVRRNLQTAGGQVLTVREQRSKRDAMADPQLLEKGTPYNGKAAVFSSQSPRLSSNDPIETAPTTRPVHPHTSSFGAVPIGI
jgi:hypothetical protein